MCRCRVVADGELARRFRRILTGVSGARSIPAAAGRSADRIDIRAVGTVAPVMTTEVDLLRVLVVEDDLGDVALVESAFDEHSVRTELHHVPDGVEALAFLHRQEQYADAPRPDLILLDLNMPRVDGRQVLAEVKADADLQSIPVVVFTTSNAPEDVLSSYIGHANAYVTKPMDLDEYDRAVAAIRNFFGYTVMLPRRGSDTTLHDGSTGDATDLTLPGPPDDHVGGGR